jgi:hypothetical protein
LRIEKREKGLNHKDRNREAGETKKELNKDGQDGQDEDEN